MPVPLLIAMILAFGLRLPTVAAPLSRARTVLGMAEAGAGAVLVGLIGWGFGLLIASRVKRAERIDPLARGLYRMAVRAVVGVGLLTYAVLLVWTDWPRVVGWGLGLRSVPVVEELAILAPYLIGQLLAVLGLYRAEARLRPEAAGLGRYLARRIRRSMGLVLPVAAIYLVGRDSFRPGASAEEDPTFALLMLCGAATVVFVLSPLIVRMTWPMEPLPAGDLRERLERLSRRLGFRYSDILVWHAGPGIVNAGVTGAVPMLRYVLVTDGLIEELDAGQIESVFAHEVGHVAHRHLPYFAAFFLGSAAALTLIAEAAERLWGFEAAFDRYVGNPDIANVLKAVMVLAGLAVYFFWVFGSLSRRFERQADLYGALAVSCDEPACPPHRDPTDSEAPSGPPLSICSEGLGTFTSALDDVAYLNGIKRSGGSWRHGTIASRIAFLERMAASPRAIRLFQRRTLVLRWALMVSLTVLAAAAWWIASFTRA